MKVAELIMRLRMADPEMEVLAAPIVELPHNYMPGDPNPPKERIRIPSFLSRFPIEDASIFGEVNTEDNKSYFMIGFDSDRPVIHPSTMRRRVEDEDDGGMVN